HFEDATTISNIITTSSITIDLEEEKERMVVEVLQCISLDNLRGDAMLICHNEDDL
ncbi:hypothetical protein WUBG_02966, partial [Wuchereria bancrofti]